LSGIVTDSSAALVPNAILRLVNSETGEAYSGTSNQNGFYIIPLIKPGNYEFITEARNLVFGTGIKEPEAL
jgi:hypothetical protein